MAFEHKCRCDGCGFCVETGGMAPDNWGKLEYRGERGPYKNHYCERCLEVMLKSVGGISQQARNLALNSFPKTDAKAPPA